MKASAEPWHRVGGAEALTKADDVLALEENLLPRPQGGWKAAFLGAAMTGVSQPLRLSNYWSLASVEGVQSEVSQTVRQILREMVDLLGQVEESDLEYDRRMNVIGSIADRLRASSGDDYEDAISRFLMADSSGVRDEVSAALIRYLSVQETLSASTIQALLTVIEGASEAKSVAAARTIGDIADEATSPALRAALRRSASERVKQEGEKALKNIAYAAGTGS